ncbi:MAG TPA: ATP-binding protein [Dokdonella sp.]|uniref:sensor histidine kinase n=1 Tax=Dokdonella sp. TaxID=2291710 RepID=UPI002D7EE1CC|nr:ATP-binding protein [Dokdonella sp.]HET9034329.1 ATP-binding protein [Dokdonella sp.]
MQRPTWIERIEYPLRAGLLAVAVLASVALPYWIIRSSANSTLEASSRVVDSAKVKGAILELQVALRDLESQVLSRLIEIPRQSGRKTYRATRDSIMPLLDQLRDVSANNAAQQNRIGALGALIEGRVKLYDRAMGNMEARNFDAATADLKQAASMFGSRQAASDIVTAENVLFLEHNEQLESAQRHAHWAVAAALFAQLMLLGSVIYVSERQTLHRRSAESRARLAVERSRLIVQTLREPIAVLDPELRVLMTNAAFTEFYAQADEPIEGGPLEKLGGHAWEDPELHQRLLDVAARGREIWDYELEQRSSDGIKRIVLVNARRMDVSDDAHFDDRPSILLTVSDVTARKRYEEQIKELNEDLETKVAQVSEINRELESFSYSVSHDLRAPLRHIAGFSDKLETHIADQADDKSRHYLEVIGGAARRMSVLIEDLLEYSRLGRSAFRAEAVDMNEMVAELRAMLVSTNEGRSIEWKIADLPVVVGDESMLQRVWQNLLSNAVKYTENREHALIEIGLSESDPAETVFFVRDNGVGFDMAYAGKLFGVFQRLHKASEFAGTGIGLANVRRIINRHGGRSWIEAEPDKGATAYFSLPTAVGTIRNGDVQAKVLKT